MKKLIVLFGAIFLLTSYHSSSAAPVTLATWDASPAGTAIAVDTNVTATTLTAGPGLTVNAGGTFNYRGWTTGAVLDEDDYFEWTLAPNAGYQFNMTELRIGYDRSGSGPSQMEVRYSTNGFAGGSADGTVIYSDASVSSGSEDAVQAFGPVNVMPGTTVTFRLYAWSATGATGTFDIEPTPLARGASPGIVIGSNTPTAIELTSFTATENEDGSVEVAWTTGAEWDHAGFNVYRSDSADTLGDKVNAEIIASTGLQGQGASYSLTDAVGRSAATYWYTLEDVDIFGVTTQHGPISITLTSPTAVNLNSNSADIAGTPAAIFTLMLLSSTAFAIISRKRKIG